MNACTFFFRRRLPILLRSDVLLLILAWNGVAFCGCGRKGQAADMHGAAKKGDLKKLDSLIKASPDLVFIKDGSLRRSPSFGQVFRLIKT